MKEDLNSYLGKYENDYYQKETLLMLKNFFNKCISYSSSKENYLELGIGHGINLGTLSRHFRKIFIIEAATEIINKYQNSYENVTIIQSYFEEYEADTKFHNIGMGFILEHVDDPALILNRYRKYLIKQGSIFVGVPNASSLHRLLAYKANMIADLTILSHTDLAFGHKRYLTYQEWIDLFEKQNFVINRSEGLYLKPFTTAQIESLHLDEKIFDALVELSSTYPEISNACFFELKNA